MTARSGQPIFGVGSLHWLPTKRMQLRLLRQALDIGFRAFDVAPAYGNGLNELRLGEALRGFGGEVEVTTKFGIPIDTYGERHPRLAFAIRVARKLTSREYGSDYARRVFTPAQMIASLEHSLRRLRREYIDDYLLHEPISPLGADLLSELGELAERLREQGKIRRWGVAGPAKSVLPQLVAFPAFDVVQAPLSDLLSLPAGAPRRIGYGAYAAYRSRSVGGAQSFEDFVKQHMHMGVDVIVTTRKQTRLQRFTEFFE